MAYCPHCGSKVEASAKFCSACGLEIKSGETDTGTRKQVYQGELRKCPSCGADVPSFTAICPECGHEFNSGRVTSAIQDFTDKLYKYDSAFANSAEDGWDTWGQSKRVWYVVLNVFTLCVPLLIKSRKKKAGFDTSKASFVENYIFPNEREAILEALLYIKSQLTTITGGAVSKANDYWDKIWFNKATQLQSKAEILIPGDSAVTQIYTDISALEQQYQKKAKKKKIIRIIIIIACIVLLYFGN